MTVDLRQLRYLVAVADHGSFSKAAIASNISQPALSRSIANMEATCGAKLFDRQASGVVPTAFGAPVIANARALLQRARRFEDDFLARSNAVAGSIAFGLGPMIANFVLAKTLSTFAVENPGVHVHVAIESGATMLQALEQDRIEFCVTSSSLIPTDGTFRIMPLVSVTPSYIVRKGHPLALRGTVTRADLDDFPTGSGAFPPVTSPLRSRMTETQAATITCENYNIMEEVMLESDMILISSFEFMTKAIQENSTILKVQDQKFPRESICAVFLADRAMSPLTQLLMKKINSIMAV